MRTEDMSYGRDYFETLDGGAGYADSTLWEDIAHTIKETFAIEDNEDRSGRVNTIDIGCAKGFLVRHLRRRGFDAWGVDISDYALENAPDDTREYLRKFDLTGRNLSHFGTKAFRLALCIETMEHIPEESVPVALDHIYQILKPGGWALFTICTDKQPGWDTDPTHVTIKSRDWWEQQLVQAGFVYSSGAILRQNRLRSFWLFSQHDGVFVVSRKG